MDDLTAVQMIKNFIPERVNGQLHFPVIYRDGSTGLGCVGCACGSDLDSDQRSAPPNQPWPRYWVGFQAFLKHVGMEAQRAANGSKT